MDNVKILKRLEKLKDLNTKLNIKKRKDGLVVNKKSITLSYKQTFSLYNHPKSFIKIYRLIPITTNDDVFSWSKRKDNKIYGTIYKEIYPILYKIKVPNGDNFSSKYRATFIKNNKIYYLDPILRTWIQIKTYNELFPVGNTIQEIETITKEEFSSFMSDTDKINIKILYHNKDVYQFDIDRIYLYVKNNLSSKLDETNNFFIYNKDGKTIIENNIKGTHEFEIYSYLSLDNALKES
jgi:hypothetical protein